MAQITEIRLVDDLDGGGAAESVAFGLDGKNYEIDLSETHAARLREVFAPFVSSARRASGASSVAPRAKVTPRVGRSREETAAIREWATAHGHPVANRGRIPAGVLAAFENRGTAPVAAAVERSESPPEAKPKRGRSKKAAPSSS